MNEDKTASAASAQGEARQARHQLDRTLAEIEQRLSPRRLIDEGIDHLRSSGGTEYLASLGNAAKRDPIPLALVGVGIAWLMMSSRRGAPDDSAGVTSPLGNGVASNGHDTDPGLGGAVAGLSDKMSQTRQKISGSVHSAVDRTREMGDVARQQAQRVRGGFDTMVNEQPLALGVIGLAVGVAMAAAAPRTQREDRLMGGASDKLGKDVKAAGREQVDKVEAAAAEAAATESVQDTPHAAANGASSVATPTPRAQDDAWRR